MTECVYRVKEAVGGSSYGIGAGRVRTISCTNGNEDAARERMRYGGATVHSTRNPKSSRTWSWRRLERFTSSGQPISRQGDRCHRRQLWERIHLWNPFLS